MTCLVDSTGFYRYKKNLRKDAKAQGCKESNKLELATWNLQLETTDYCAVIPCAIDLASSSLKLP